MTEDEPRGNLLALVISRGALVAAGVAVQVLATRGLGPDGFGLYGYLLSVASIFGAFASWGLRMLLVPEVARAPERVQRILGASLPVVLLSGLGTTALVVGWVALQDGRGLMVAAAALVGVTFALIGAADVVQATFHGLRRMRLEVRGVVGGKLLAIGLTMGWFLWGGGLISLALAQLAGAVLTVAVLGSAFRAHVGRPALAAGDGLTRRLWRDGSPFAWNLFFGSVYAQVDVLLLASWASEAEVGLYRAAAILLVHLPIAAQVLNRGLFPKVARLMGDPVAAGAELRFATRVVLALGVPVAAGGIWLAEPIMVVLGGEAFRVAAPLLGVLLLGLPLRYVNNTTGMALSALGRQGWRTGAVVVAAALNIGLNLALIPRFGAMAAAWVTVGTEVWLMIAFGAGLRGAAVGVGTLGAALRAAGAAAVMLVALAALGGLGLPSAAWLPVAVVAGAGVYAFAARAVGVWEPGDLDRLWRV